MPYQNGEAGWKATQTSAEAARSIRPSAANLRQRVLDDLLAHPGPATCDEIAERTGIPLENVRPRITELREAGRIEDSGIRRLTRFSKRSIAWRIARKDST